MVSICGLQCANSAIIFLLFATLISFTQCWPRWKRQQRQYLRLQSQNLKAPLALAEADGSPTNSLSIAAKTLTDRYYSELSVVSVRQEPNILDLASRLSGPEFATIEDDIMSASSRLAVHDNPRAQSGAIVQRTREQPPEDEDDEDVDDEKEEEKNEEEQEREAIPGQSLHLSNTDKSANDLKLDTDVDVPIAERSLDTVTSKVISMSKVILKAGKLLLGSSFDVFGGAMLSPVKMTVARVIKERKLSTCSKISLVTVVKENEKLESLIRSNKCDGGSVFEHSLINLKVSLTILKCYLSATSNDDQSIKDEISRFDKQILDLSRTMIDTDKTYKRSFSRGHSDELLTKSIKAQVTELQNKFSDLLTTELILRLSIYDSFMHTFTMNIQRIMREFSEDIATYFSQRTTAEANNTDNTDNADNDAIIKEYCTATLNSGRLLSDDIRSLGTTTVDKLIGAAKNIVDSFEGMTIKLSQGLDRLNSYRDMFERLFQVAKNFNPELSE